jgi:two-component system LytT family response regulator
MGTDIVRGTSPNAAVAFERQLRSLLHEMRGEISRPARVPPVRYHARIAVKVGGTTRIMPIADVDWFETDGNYMRVHVGPSSYLMRYTANRLERDLDPRRFVRIHRRYLVNLDRIVGLEPWFGSDAVVVLRGGRKLRLSRNYRDELDARMLGDRPSSGE